MGAMAKRIRGAKFINLNESSEERAQRALQQEAARTQAIQRETAELERQALLRAAFHATPEDFQILNRLVDAGGRIPAEQILISDAAGCCWGLASLVTGER